MNGSIIATNQSVSRTMATEPASTAAIVAQNANLTETGGLGGGARRGEVNSPSSVMSRTGCSLLMIGKMVPFRLRFKPVPKRARLAKTQKGYVR